jgi:putative ABC transport system permease protein
MALGAQPASVLALVLNQGLRLVFAGLSIGLAIAAAATRILARFLYGLSTLDWITFAGTCALLTAVALVACYVPARRAARVDPIVALRYE